MTHISLTTFLDAVVRTGPALLAGTTLLLSAGCLAVWPHRGPIHRQRLGELTIAGVLVWLIFALMPLPRPLGVDGLSSRWKVRVDPLPDESVALPIVPAKELSSPDPLVRPKIEHDWTAQPPVEIPGGQDPPPTKSPTISREAIAALVNRLQLAQAAATTSEPSREIEAAIPIRSEESLHAESQTPALMAKAVAFAKAHGLRALAGIYVAGCAVCFSWLLLGSWLLRCVVRRAHQPDGWLREAFEQLTEPGRMARTRLLLSPRYPRAMSFGVWRPTIVLPAAECRPENAERLRHVLRHELAHVRQRDAWSNLLLNLAFVPLYFHPCFWWLRSQIRMSAELLADDLAARQSSTDDYARELIAFARSCRGRAPNPAWRPAGAAGILGSSTQFSRRIEMLIQRERPLAASSSRRWRLVITAGAVACLTVLTASIGTPVRAQSAADTSPEAPSDLVLRDVSSFDVAFIDPDAELAKKPSKTEGPADNTSQTPGAKAAPTDEQVEAIRRERDELKAKTAKLEAELQRLKLSAKLDNSPQVGSTFSFFVPPEVIKVPTTNVSPNTAYVPNIQSVAAYPSPKGQPLSLAGKPTNSKSQKLDVRAINLQYVSPLEFRSALLAIFPGMEQKSAMRIWCDDRTNRLLLIGAGDEEAKTIEAVIKLIDVPADEHEKPKVVSPKVVKEEILEEVKKRKGEGTLKRKLGYYVGPKHAAKATPATPNVPSEKVSEETFEQMKPGIPELPSYPEAPVTPQAASDPFRPSTPASPLKSKWALHTVETPPDLVTLAIAYSDAVSQVLEYRPRIQRLRKLVAAGTVENQLLDSATAKLQHAERKVKLLHGMIQSLRAALAEQIKLGQSRLEFGSVTNSERDLLIERKAKLAVLEQILAEDADKPQKSAPEKSKPVEN